MRTYTEYLNSLTVKALHSIAKQGGYKRYSKLRKAELIAFIDGEILIDWDGAAQVKILNVTEVADQPEIVKIMAQVAPVTFSATPVKPAQMTAKPRTAIIPTATPNPYAAESTEELILAYRNMIATQHNARGIMHAKLEARLGRIERVLKSRKVNMREV